MSRGSDASDPAISTTDAPGDETVISSEPATTRDGIRFDVARVDLQADPSRWLPSKVLGILAVIMIGAAVVTIVVCLILWLTPPMHPIDLPSVPKG